MKKMEKNKIYLPLQGRIGNQLFQYAFARKLQLEMPNNPTIIMDDSDIIRCNWEKSLMYYDLPNVEYIHESILENRFVMSKQYFLRKIYRVLTRKKNYMDKFKMESKLNPFFNKSGLFFCENGYMEQHLNIKKPIYIEGYFQSQKYFNEIKADLLTLFDGTQFPDYDKYPGLYKLRERNSVCISVKVEHNVGSSMYDVCSMKYWEEAIQYVIKNVDNPLFFICSDNVDYVLEHLIDASKYDYVVQDKSKPVYVSLAAMSECKNFIIGNTTFGWWAQYLSKADKKIVVAPSKWMSVDMPLDLYEDSWHLIEV